MSHSLRTWVDALERLLARRRELEVLESHNDLRWVRHAVVHQQADVLLTHVAPNDTDALVTVRELRRVNKQFGVVALSESTDRQLLVTAVRAGVRGWVAPTASLHRLVGTVVGVGRGETWIPAPLVTLVIDDLLHEQHQQSREPADPWALSDREREILLRLAGGCTRRQIADELGLSPHTVRTHINNLLHKLEVHSVVAAVSMARQAGLAGRGA